MPAASDTLPETVGEVADGVAEISVTADVGAAATELAIKASARPPKIFMLVNCILSA